MDKFSPSSPPLILWKSRKRSAAVRLSDESLKVPTNNSKQSMEIDVPSASAASDDQSKLNPISLLSERRRALFEPLEPPKDGLKGISGEALPPPDFDSTSYPKGWLVGKKRKLVNVDVVESMRRIAIQEMNRKDREIDGLNEQLEEDSRCLEHLQLQLLEEKSKRADVERENALLQNQISMLMNMLGETQSVDEDEEGPGEDP